jgi:hypothetical protein
MASIICVCGKTIFDGEVLRIRVGVFRSRQMTLKCPSCKRMLGGIPVEYLTGEVHETVRFIEKMEAVTGTLITKGG